MLTKWLVVIFVTLHVKYSAAQCVKFLNEIVAAERTVLNTSIKRTYILCPGTRFKPGTVDPDTGQIPSGDTPLACRSNCTIQCGTDGEASNDCVIEATGTYAILMIPSFVFATTETAADNILVKGVTVDGFKRADQIPMITASYTGNVRFEKCIFSQNSADPFIVVDQFVGLRRQRYLGYGESTFMYPRLGDFESLRRQDDMSGDIGIVQETPHRRLQTSPFTVTFERCKFDSNYAASRPRTQAGLSLIRFRAANPSNPVDRIGSLHAKFIRNTFIHNDFFLDDSAKYRSLIDFHSLGTLHLEKNCFQDSPIETLAIITTQSDSKIVNIDNYVDPIQTSAKCEFIAKVDAEYQYSGSCGTKAAATECKVDAVAAPFCFPETAYCQVQGRGLVAMKDIKLGDKVLVDHLGKYESVYSFGHHSANVDTRYLKFITSNNQWLEISEEHMVYLAGGPVVPASQVHLGDKLLTTDIRNPHAIVKDIQVVQRRGAFAPFTGSGTVVVNGFVASTFIAFQNQATLHIAGIDTGLSFQFLARAFEGPHRMWCNHVSECLVEDYTMSGVSVWVDVPHKVSRWFVAQNNTVMALLSLPLLVLLMIMAYPGTTVTAIILFVLVANGSFQHKYVRIKSKLEDSRSCRITSLAS